MRGLRRAEQGAKPSRRVAVTAALVASHALLFLLGVNWARLRTGVSVTSTTGAYAPAVRKNIYFISRAAARSAPHPLRFCGSSEH